LMSARLPCARGHGKFIADIAHTPCSVIKLAAINSRNRRSVSAAPQLHGSTGSAGALCTAQYDACSTVSQAAHAQRCIRAATTLLFIGVFQHFTNYNS
jgi:predicted ABC-class ATPase